LQEIYIEYMTNTYPQIDIDEVTFMSGTKDVVFLVKNEPQEAQARLQQAVGWLDKSISAPPCPTHGHQREEIKE
jgi:hypothetical protein